MRVFGKTFRKVCFCKQENIFFFCSFSLTSSFVYGTSSLSFFLTQRLLFNGTSRDDHLISRHSNASIPHGAERHKGSEKLSEMISGVARRSGCGDDLLKKHLTEAEEKHVNILFNGGVLKQERRSQRRRCRNQSHGGTRKAERSASLMWTRAPKQINFLRTSQNISLQQLLTTTITTTSRSWCHRGAFFFFSSSSQHHFFYVERNKEQHLAKTCVFFKRDLNKPGFVGLWVIGQRGLAQGNFGQI